MQLTIQGQNFSELKSKVSQLYHEMCETVAAQTEMDLPDLKTKTKKSKGKKEVSKEEMDALVPASTTQPVETTTEGAVKASVSSALTKENVTEKLQEVNAKLGIVTARGLLQQFSANRISDLKPESYAHFIERCDEALSVV